MTLRAARCTAPGPIAAGPGLKRFVVDGPQKLRPAVAPSTGAASASNIARSASVSISGIGRGSWKGDLARTIARVPDLDRNRRCGSFRAMPFWGVVRSHA